MFVIFHTRPDRTISGVLHPYNMATHTSGPAVNGAGDVLVPSADMPGEYIMEVEEELTGIHVFRLVEFGITKGHGWVNLEDGSGSYIVKGSLAEVVPATGTGARTVAITVTDGTDPVEGALVRLSKGAESFSSTTDVNGEVSLNVNDGTWTVAITAAGYSFGGDALIVNSDETVEYELTQIVLTPSDIGLTTGYLIAYSHDGEPEENVVVKLIVREVPSDLEGYAFDGQTRTGTSDENGLVEFPNMVKGVTYSLQRGTSKKLYSVTIPTDAGPTYALPSIIGQDT